VEGLVDRLKDWTLRLEVARAVRSARLAEGLIRMRFELMQLAPSS
jgi:hypothetical protein